MLKEEAVDQIEELESDRSIDKVELYMLAFRVLEQFPRDKEVMERLAFRISANAQVVPKIVINAGGVEVLLKIMAMDHWMQNERLISECLEGLRIIGENPEGLERIVHVKAFEAIIEVMTKMPQARWVQQEGVGALCQLAQSQKGRLQLLPTSCIELVVGAMSQFKKLTWVQMWGSQVIEILAELDKFRVYDTGAFFAAERARKNPDNKKSESVVRSATRAVRLRPTLRELATREDI